MRSMANNSFFRTKWAWKNKSKRETNREISSCSQQPINSDISPPANPPHFARENAVYTEPRSVCGDTLLIHVIRPPARRPRIVHTCRSDGDYPPTLKSYKAMEVVSLASESIQISVSGLNTSLAAPAGCCSQLQNAADIDVKLVSEHGGYQSYQTARGHLSASNGAILHLALPGLATISSLTVELSEPGYGNVVAIGATTAKYFSEISVGNLEIALICPDILKFVGSLQASFLRSGPEIEKLPDMNTFKLSRVTQAKLVPAGLLASGELARAPSSVSLQNGDGKYKAQVSRSALSGTASLGIDNGKELIVLGLCAGDIDLSGGSCDLNQLAAKAVHALGNGVIALATSDVQVATVLMAIAPPDTPAIWTGARKDVAKRLRMPASIHPDFHSGIHVEKKSSSEDNDDEVLLVPSKLLRGDDGNDDETIDPENDNRLKRKKSSVRWASPLSTRCTIEEKEVDGTA